MESAKISPEELALLEQLFQEGLRESPIDLEMYRELAENDEDIKSALEEMLRYSLEYTEDVAKMEKYIRENTGKFDEERDELDKKRSTKHDATILSINVFARILTQKGVQFDWLKWGKDDRASYGNFAILLTLNRFKDEIILKKIIERHETDIDFESMKRTAGETELLVIKYVEILTGILKDDDAEEETLDDQEPDQRIIELEETRKAINKPETQILGAFHQIYMKRYGSLN